MERPERPTRHKSRPVKFNFISDSDSDPNDSDVSLPLYTGSYMSLSEPAISGASSSAAGQLDDPSSTTEPSTSTTSNARGVSPTVTTVTISPMPHHSQDTETHSEPPDVPVPLAPRRKRNILDSFRDLEDHLSNLPDPQNTFDGPSTSSSSRRADRELDGSPERSNWNFLPSRSSIRLRSFCQNKCGNAYHKFKRPTEVYDLFSPPASASTVTNLTSPPVFPRPTPSVISAPIRVENDNNRDQNGSGLVVTSSFSLREPTALPTNSEAASQTPFFRRTSDSGSDSFRLMSDQPDPPSGGSSSILRQFDEICSTPIRKRHRPMSIRFNDTANTSGAEVQVRPSRFSGAAGTSQNDSTNNPINFSTRSSNVDDYSDLVGQFLFNYSNNMENSDPIRNAFRPGTSGRLTRTPPASTSGESQVRPASSDLMMSALNALLHDSARTNNSECQEPMEQSNDDVIVVEPPEIEDMVPSSRSPSPTHPRQPTTTPPARDTSATTPHRDKSAEGSGGQDVPMTLQELNQSLVSLLECPVCLDHATPPIYQCCKGHILCQNCHPRLTSCPICRSRLPGDRNSAMEKVAEKLMYPCKNTVTGCGMMVKLSEKQSHEEGCGFRHYACVVTTCSWKGYKPELVVHLQSHHPDKLITGTTKEVRVPLMPAYGGAMVFSHEWIHSAHNEVFNVLFKIDLYKRIMKGCVIYIGSPERSSKFSYHFELKQRVPPYRKLSYSRTTHCEIRQPMCLNNDFSINIDMARIYRPDDCLDTTIPVYITISQEE